MGEAYTSVSEDAYSAWWNPAGLASVDGAGLAATYNDSMGDVVHQYLSAVYPIHYGSTLGFTLTRLGVAPFQGYDSQGAKTGQVGSSDYSVGGAYGRALLKDEIERPVLNVGVGVKMIGEKLGNASANTAAVDLGVLYYIRPANYWMRSVPAQELRVALSVRNLGPGLKFDRRSSPLPVSVTLGGSWHSHPGGNAGLILSLDQTVANDEKYHPDFGAEYVAYQLLSFRAGYCGGQSVGTGLRVGVGFHLSLLDIDYSMSPYGELGAMHKLGVSMRFGAPVARQPLAGKTARAEKAKLIAPKEKIEKLEMFAKDFLELAQKALAERKYVAAYADIQKAFNLDPGLVNGEWGRVNKRLDSIIVGLKLVAIPQREQVLARDSEQTNLAAEAISAYIEGKELKGFLFAHAASGTDLHGDVMYEELLNMMSDYVNMPVRRDEVLPLEALVKEKLRKAAGWFYDQHFDAAVRECEEVSIIDEKNPVAWTRLGSAYFMMGDKDKAKRAYRKAVQLNPEDRMTKQLMDEQGWTQGTESK